MIYKTFKEIKELCSSSKVDEGMNMVFGEDYHTSELITKESDIKVWINTL